MTADYYGSATDLFSFGVLLSELDSHQLPYEDLRNSDGKKIPEVVTLEMIARGELRPSFLPTCPSEIARLADKCLAVQPEMRPTSIQVAYWLRMFLKKCMERSDVNAEQAEL